jgi:pimeloyl-ACP methyl ester carboxylesterase
MPPVDPSRVTSPVTLVVGEHDATHRELAAKIAGELTDARLAVAEGAGHNVLLERPDVVAQILART